MIVIPSAAEASIECTTLSNGVRVITDRMDGLASATLGVWVGAGARHETAEENGLAHFLEHMAFKGTPNRSARQIAEDIEDVGGYLNAYTSREVTAYYARVLSEDAPLAFDILSDILRNPSFAEEDVEVERGVILQEIGQALDTPDDIIFDWAQEQAFPDQPIGRPILGPSQNVARFQAHHLRRFIAQHYAPDRIVIAAAGGVDHAQILALAERCFGDMTPLDAPQAPPATYSGGERRVEKDLEQAHVLLGFKANGYRAPDFYTGQVYATLLGGGMSSRLFQEVREERGLCYTIFAQPSHYADTGFMTIYAGTGGEQTVELLNVVTDQLRGLSASVMDEEIARAKAQIRAGMLMGLETPSARCERLARGLLAHGRVAPVAEVTARIENITREDVAHYANSMISGAPPTLSLYGPGGQHVSLDCLQQRLAA